MYDLRKLEILFELSQLGSLAQVADTLGYNPSTVSQHLASLQREVGQQLVEKNGRGVVLTAHGQELAGYAANMLTLMERARIAMHTDDARTPRTIRLASFNSAARFMVPRLYDAVQKTAPHLDIQLTQLEPEHSLREIERHHFDIVVAEEYAHRPVSLGHSLERVDLWEDPIVLFAPRNLLPDQPALESKKTRYALQNIPWCLEPIGTEFRAWTDRFLTAQQLTPTPRFISTDLAWQLDLAEQGLAATVLPQLVLAHRNVSDRVWVSEALGARSVFAAVRASSMHDPAIRLVLNELKSAKRTK